MKNLKLFTVTMVTLLIGVMALAGFQGVNGTTSLGIFNKFTCGTGTTCTKTKDSMTLVSSPTISTGALAVKAATSTAATVDVQANNNATNGDDWQLQSKTSQGGLSFLNNTSGSLVQKMLLDTSGNLTVVGTTTHTGAAIFNGGITPQGTIPKTRSSTWAPEVVTNATSTVGAVTSVYMSQVNIPYNVTLTGIGILNAATVGTNKYIVVLFNDAGTVIANSALAGVTTSGASVYQQIPFTGTVAVQGPRTYWLGVYLNGTTDTYYAMPTLAQAHGLAGEVTGQTFGTVAAVTPPTTFTAAKGPVSYVY